MATAVTVHEHANSYSTNRKIQINGHLPFALLHNLLVRKKAFKPQNVRKKKRNTFQPNVRLSPVLNGGI